LGKKESNFYGHQSGGIFNFNELNAGDDNLKFDPETIPKKWEKLADIQ
jgi:hypothetical protein